MARKRKREPSEAKTEDLKDPSSTQGSSESQELDFYLQTIEGLQKERNEHYDLLLRKQAEFENFRKRVLKEKEGERLLGHSELLRELLPVVDACEKGLGAMEEQDHVELGPYREGYELLLRRLNSVLEKFGVTEIEGVGTHFDPNVHEAVSREITSEHEEGKILGEFQKGYKIKDRLLRPSRVRVAVPPQEED